MNPSEIQREGQNQLAGELCSPMKVAGSDSVGPADRTMKPDMAPNEASLGDIENRPSLPPGQHPYDPVKKDIDPIGFALHRVQTSMIWIDEYRASFEKLRHTDQDAAESELSNLRGSTVEAMIHLQRLSELLLAGYTIDPGKRLPDSLQRGWFSSYVKRLLGGEPEAEESQRKKD